MSLDASGKPVVVARPASAKPGSSMPSKIKTSSSTSHSVPGSKPKGSASGNRSTAASQRPGSAKPSRGRLAPLSIPSGSKIAQSMLVCSGSVLSDALFLITSMRSNTLVAAYSICTACKWHSKAQGTGGLRQGQHNLMTQVAIRPRQKITVTGNKLSMTAAVLFLVVAAA